MGLGRCGRHRFSRIDNRRGLSRFHAQRRHPASRERRGAAIGGKCRREPFARGRRGRNRDQAFDVPAESVRGEPGPDGKSIFVRWERFQRFGRWE